MMKTSAAVLSVGNEVLRGSVVNSNAAFLGKELTAAGFEVVTHSVCPDSIEAIRFQLGELIRRVEVVIMCGGIGPTPDDVTREGVAAFFNVPLVFSKDQHRRLEKLYRHFGRRMPPLVKREAFYPKGAKPLINRFGVALGFATESRGKIVVALPGVPSELENMYFDVVLPFLKKKFPKTAPLQRLIVRMTGISEPDVMKKLGKDFFSEIFDFGIYPSSGEIMVRIFCEHQGVLRRLRRKIGARLKDYIYSWDDQPLVRILGELLHRKKMTLAVAESCTGGLLASELTRVPGASEFFKGGIIAYHHTVKEKLGVAQRSIKLFGEVSPQVARELAVSVRSRMETDFGIGITGIAGPGGGKRKKPVGLVYISLSKQTGKAEVWEHRFWGNRQQVQKRAAIKALEYLWRAVR